MNFANFTLISHSRQLLGDFSHLRTQHQNECPTSIYCISSQPRLPKSKKWLELCFSYLLKREPQHLMYSEQQIIHFSFFASRSHAAMSICLEVSDSSKDSHCKQRSQCGSDRNSESHCRRTRSYHRLDIDIILILTKVLYSKLHFV